MRCLAIEPLEVRVLLSVFAGDSKSAIAPWAAIGDGQAAASVRFSFEASPKLERLGNGYAVSMSGEETWLAEGSPVVPVRPSTIVLPPGMEISSVAVDYLDPGTVLGTGVQLTAAPSPGSPGQSEDWTSLVAADFPGVQSASYSNSTLSGYQLGTLRVFPIQYDAATATLTYHNKIAVTVTTTPMNAGSALAPRGSVADRERVAGLVDNPEALSAYDGATYSPGAPVPGTFGAVSSPSALGDPLPSFEYVIVTSSALEASFQPLIAQKQSRGLSAAIVTTEYIYANYTGLESPALRDNADKIRNFIRDAYQNHGTRWVLLGGDVEVVPNRGVYVNANGTITTDMPTDMYFACLDGPWNGNGNAYWGERTDGSNGGDVDLTAEVYIGRAPVSNATEAANFVAKTIQYETTAHPNPRKAVFLGEKLDPWVYGSASSIDIRNATLPATWLPELVEHYDTATYTWPAAGFISDLNASPHIIESLGHSNASMDSRITTTDVGNLTNAFPYFMYSQGCDAGSFDTVNVSIAEKHVVAEHGAFGVVMNARDGWYDPMGNLMLSHDYAKAFWDAVFNEGKFHLGEANQDSKDDNLWMAGVDPYYRWIHFETNLFGDPETPLQISNVPPRANDDSYVTPVNTVLTVDAPGVLANDTDANQDPLTAVQVTDAAHGTVALAADGSFTYTPATGYYGTDSFTYKASDGTYTSNTATVSIKVNTIPVAANDSYLTPPDTVLTVDWPGVVGNDVDQDGDWLNEVLVAGPSHGSLDFWDGPFQYTPDPGFVGFDTFTYRATDGYANSNIATVTITVAPTTLTGTPGADTFEFIAAGGVGGLPTMHQLRVTLAGSPMVTYLYDAAGPVSLSIDAKEGSDKLTITGGPGKDTTVLNRYYVQHTGPGATTAPGYYSVYGNNLETIIDNAGAGTAQRSTLNDSLDNGDVFTASALLKTGSMKSAAGSPNVYNNSSTGYDQIYGIGGNGGINDRADLYDSNGNDYYVSRAGAMTNPISYIQRSSGGTGTAALVTAVSGFEYVYGMATAGGVDEAVLFGSNGDDSMRFEPGYTSGTLIVPRVYMTRPGGYFIYAQNFKKVTGYPEDGNDQVAFFDTTGNDVFTASPTDARLTGPAGSNILNIATTDLVNPNYRWDAVRAYSQVGGYDKAYLTGSTGDDTFLGYGKPRTVYPGMGRLTGTGYFLEVYQFEEVYANLLTGNDTANLYDGSANDYFWAKAGAAVLTDGTVHDATGDLVTPNTYYYKVYGFDSAASDHVNAYGTSGGTNTKRVITPLDYVLATYGLWADAP